jgi:hypothetical protein
MAINLGSRRIRWLAFWFTTAVFATGLPGGLAGDERPVSFNRDIRPILSFRCFTCHGVDSNSRQADLRLDVRESAVGSAIIPGKADESPLIKRAASTDPDELMPPPSSKKPPLSAAELAVVRRWINEGAKYEPHWAYAPLQRPAVPEVKRADWAVSPIDRFIAAGHQEHGLEPAATADPRTLVRRLALDLTGLPPSPAEIDAWAADPSPAAYEKLVDRLLASPQYGERMAVYWLDVVRYADSGGYHSDNDRNVWLYRDYVIQSFNDNKPFDRFTIEQLAGDLLPPEELRSEGGRWEKIASGYNKLLQTTEEGGAQPKEYTAKYAADRVRNTAVAWLGSSMGCATCHNHKYDPFTMKDFYSLGAMFADVQESPVGRQPETPMPTAEQAAKLSELDAAIAPLQKQLDTPTPELEAAQAEWEKAVLDQPADKRSVPKPIAEILAVAADKRNDAQKATLAAHYRLEVAPALDAVRKPHRELKTRRDALQNEIPKTLITVAVAPREMRILPRGNWQDDSGEIVQPAIPEFLGKLDVKDRRANRLDLARWMVSRDNPLVSRTFVNRVWRMFFGQGIARNLDDLGTQGALPTHPELLDYLAVDFIDSGWDVKRLVKQMVMSQAYRQSSHVPPEVRNRDPGNLYLARQAEFRLDAEFVRDNALLVSGLLANKLGGPSVKPYQPAGYWSYLNFPKREWAADKGESLYRRSLYTWWQRTFLHPSLLAFDASTREECTAERARSNTPLQALTLLNDPIFVEAARVFAVRMIREGGSTEPERMTFAFRQALGRLPRAEETSQLSTLYQRHLAEYRADEGAARQLLLVGDTKAPDDVPAAELAAWTSVARVVLNLHEMITRY